MHSLLTTNRHIITSKPTSLLCESGMYLCENACTTQTFILPRTGHRVLLHWVIVTFGIHKDRKGETKM